MVIILFSQLTVLGPIRQPRRQNIILNIFTSIPSYNIVTKVVNTL